MKLGEGAKQVPCSPIGAKRTGEHPAGGASLKKFIQFNPVMKPNNKDQQSSIIGRYRACLPIRNRRT
jgi:hypothetical protein